MAFKLIDEASNVVSSAFVKAKLPEYILDCIMGIEPDSDRLSDHIFDEGVECMSDNPVVEKIFEYLRSCDDISDDSVIQDVADMAVDMIVREG